MLEDSDSIPFSDATRRHFLLDLESLELGGEILVGSASLSKGEPGHYGQHIIPQQDTNQQGIWW